MPATRLTVVRDGRLLPRGAVTVRDDLEPLRNRHAPVAVARELASALQGRQPYVSWWPAPNRTKNVSVLATGDSRKAWRGEQARASGGQFAEAAITNDEPIKRPGRFLGVSYARFLLSGDYNYRNVRPERIRANRIAVSKTWATNFNRIVERLSNAIS